MDSIATIAHEPIASHGGAIDPSIAYGRPKHDGGVARFWGLRSKPSNSPQVSVAAYQEEEIVSGGDRTVSWMGGDARTGLVAPGDVAVREAWTQGRVVVLSPRPSEAAGGRR